VAGDALRDCERQRREQVVPVEAARQGPAHLYVTGRRGGFSAFARGVVWSEVVLAA
jgi:hypothetical protein